MPTVTAYSCILQVIFRSIPELIALVAIVATSLAFSKVRCNSAKVLNLYMCGPVPSGPGFSQWLCNWRVELMILQYCCYAACADEGWTQYTSTVFRSEVNWSVCTFPWWQVESISRVWHLYLTSSPFKFHNHNHLYCSWNCTEKIRKWKE